MTSIQQRWKSGTGVEGVAGFTGFRPGGTIPEGMFSTCTWLRAAPNDTKTSIFSVIHFTVHIVAGKAHEFNLLVNLDFWRLCKESRFYTSIPSFATYTHAHTHK